MTEDQEQTGGDWEQLPRPAEPPGPQRDDGKNSVDAEVERGSNRNADLLQMLRAAESRAGGPHSRDKDPAEATGPVAEAQRMDLVSLEINVVHESVRLCECDRGSVNVHKLKALMIPEGRRRSVNISLEGSALILGY